MKKQMCDNSVSSDSDESDDESGGDESDESGAKSGVGSMTQNWLGLVGPTALYLFT